MNEVLMRDAAKPLSAIRCSLPALVGSELPCCYAHMAREKIVWQITDRCTLNCPYCFTPSRARRDIPLGGALKIVDALRKQYPLKTRLLFAGREPLLYPGIIQLVECAVAHRFTCSLSTSGELLSAVTAQDLAHGGLKKINLSLISYEPYVHEQVRPGSNHARVVQAIDAALQAGLQVKVNVSLTSESLCDVEGTIEYLSLRGVRHISLGLIHPFRIGSEFSPVVSGGLLARLKSITQQVRSEGMQLTLVIPPRSKPCHELSACPIRQGLVSVLPDGHVVGCNIYPDLPVMENRHG